MHYRRHSVDTTTAEFTNDGTTPLSPSNKKHYSAASLMDQRDFLGAITLIEFERELKQESHAQANVEQLEYLAFCYFHLANYDKAISIYTQLYEKESSDPVYQLFIACCLFHAGRYEQCIECLQRAPSNRLSNRVWLHLSYLHYNDESKLKTFVDKLSDSPSDQLSLAAVHYFRHKYQNATDIYKREWMKHKSANIAIQIYVAYCFFELDRYDTSNDIIAPYLAKHPQSIIALNLRACNNYRLYNGKMAENDIRSILDVMQVSNCENPFFNLVRHNICVFRDGENALEVLPPLIHSIKEARLNLCIYHLKNEQFVEAYQMLSKYVKKPKSAIEYILKAIVCCCIGQIKQSENELNVALKYFELVGSSQSECDTIPGRQCMASSHMLRKSFDDVLIYLESIKEYIGVTQQSMDIFNFNYGLALSHTGKHQQAESVLLLVQNAMYTMEYTYMSHLCRCYVMNGRPWEAWNLYLSGATANNDDDAGVTTANLTSTNWNLLYLIAHDCYKMGHFYYAAKAFDVMEATEPTTEYWNGKRGACCGVFQLVIAGKEMKEHLLDIMAMLSNDSNPQSNFILRVMRQWCADNGIQDY